ncbi:unnamed protein product, partial [Meganyctiphanes norvegica]
MARRIILNTGNLLELDDIIKRGANTTAEELISLVKYHIASWQNSEIRTEYDDFMCVISLKDEKSLYNDPSGFQNILSMPGSEGKTKIISMETGFKVYKALFITKDASSFVIEKKSRVRSDLSLKCIDSVILVPPDVSDYVDVDMVAPAWKALEEAVNEGQILSIGIADVGAKLLENLYNWAQVKPSSVQVNVSSCCVVPKELSAFAEQNDVQVLTHNDPPEIIDEEVVSTISSRLGVTDPKVDWIVRHRIIQQCFALVHSKGWTVALSCSP